MSRALADILRLLNPSGRGGFEGLIAALLESLTGRHFSLARSGSQEGRDMSSRQVYANVIAVECKRYGQNTELDERELLGELVQVAQAISDLDVWVLVSSRDVDSQLNEALHETATQKGVEFFSISSGDGSPSSLEVLCAYSQEVVITHPGIQGVATAEEVRGLLQMISENPQFEQRVAALKETFSSPLVGYENWRVEQNRWFLNSLKSSREVWANYGQLINVEDEDIRLIKRESAWSALSEWLRTWKDTHLPFTVLGEEGDGKTWAVASWLSQNIQNNPQFPGVIFFSSTYVSSNEPIFLLSEVISRRLGLMSEEQAQQRLYRWMKRQSGETPLLLLVLDGINQHGSREGWRTFLNKLAGEPWFDHNAVIVTCRTGYWQPYFGGLRHPATSRFTISPYGDTELNAALAHYNLRRDDIQDNLLPLIRKPRYFDLMVKHRDRIAESGDITIARLIYEDWRDRLERKTDIPLTDDEFQNLIRRLAEKHQGRDSLLSEREIVDSLPVFSDGQCALEELRTGGVLKPQRGTYQVDKRMLEYGLGLLLVDQLEQAAAQSRDLREAVAGWLEPHPEMDLKAAICEYAALHALGIRDFPRDAKVALLQAWIDSRNPGPEAESNFTAYWPVDPESYVALAEVVWSDSYDNAWAQELLIRSFLKWHQSPRVSSILRSACERWLGFVHIYGSPFVRHTTEDEERARQEISQRIGRDIQLGPFSFADYPLTAIEDDGQLRLGRAALAVISYLPRNEFIRAIAIGCVAEAIMGRPDKYDLFAWVIRTSSEPIWTEIKEEVVHLLSVNNVVTQQAAHRLLSFEGSEDAYRLQETIPDDIFPTNPLIQRHKQDPCTSGFSWSLEDCITCLQRRDLAIDWVARQIKLYCVDPDLPVPDGLKTRFSQLVDKLDTRSMWSLLGPTEADIFFEMYEPSLAAYAPNTLADFVRSIVRQISERLGIQRRQPSLYLREHYLIFAAEEKEAIQRVWDELISAADAWGEAEETAEMFLFKLALVGMNAEDQLSSLLRRPERALDWIEYEESFLPITHWEMVREEFAQATNTKTLTRILWFISASPSSVPHDLLNASIISLVNHGDSYIRSLVLEIVYGVQEPTSTNAVIESGWTWSPTHSELENHWGSLVLCKYGLSVLFDELCRRIHPSYLGYAVMCRGDQASEVRIYAESIHQIWLRLPTSPDLPMDLPDFTIDADVSGKVERISRRGLPEGTFSRSVTFFQSPHASWGGTQGESADSGQWNTDAITRRQNTLLQIIREAVEQQEASGNFWFGRPFRPIELNKVIEQYPNLVSEWVRTSLADGIDTLRLISRSGSFYAALCTALLEEDVDAAVQIYWRLQGVVSPAHGVDKNTGIELLDFDLFRSSPSDTLKDTWKRILEACNTDQSLMKVALLCQFGTGKDWLWSYVTERITSSAPIDRARSIALLGFVDDQDALEALQKLLQLQSDTWVKDLAKTSKQRWDRNSWAKHWFRRFLTADDDVTSWASFRLFLQCVDTRFWFWREVVGVEVGESNISTQRSAFLRDNLETIHHSIRDNEKDMAKHFLGRKILERQVWPWMSFP
jgi:hypothetical protein